MNPCCASDGGRSSGFAVQVLTDTQFAHDGVSEHADVVVHVLGALASGSAPWRRAARARPYAEEITCRDGLPRRFRSSTLRACGAGRLALERSPQRGLQRTFGVPPNVCTRMSSPLQELSTVPLHVLDAVMCTGPGGQHEGGPATVTDLEQDLHDVLAEWAAGADQAVVLFGATALSERIDAIESGSWETFLSGLVGNTVWAATTFIPPGDLAFGLSVAGIGLAAAPTVPSKSKSAIPEVTKMMQDYINGVTMAMTPKLREPAAARLADHPGETRYRALASIVRNSFQPGTYTIDTGYATAPTLNRTAIRDRMLDVANERLQIAIDVGSAHTLPHDKEHWSDRTRVTEVAYVRGSFGRPRLAILKSNWQGPDTHDGTVPDGSSHELIRWVTDEGKRAAIDQWMTQRQNQPPQTYPPQAIDGLVG